MLGVPVDASPATIKAAWRRLAREHHPDVVGVDPAASRAATRRMAEINAAYEDLRTDAGRRRPGAATGPRPARPGADGRSAGRQAGPTGPAESYNRSGPIGTAGRAPGVHRGPRRGVQ